MRRIKALEADRDDSATRAARMHVPTGAQASGPSWTRMRQGVSLRTGWRARAATVLRSHPRRPAHIPAQRATVTGTGGGTTSDSAPPVHLAAADDTQQSSLLVLRAAVNSRRAMSSLYRGSCPDCAAPLVFRGHFSTVSCNGWSHRPSRRRPALAQQNYLAPQHAPPPS